MEKNKIELFNWNDDTTSDSLKDEIVKWYNGLSILEQSYIEILRKNAQMDELDAESGEDL